MLFLAMYTFVIVTMCLCGQRNTSPKMKQRNDTNPQTHTGRPRRTRKGNHVTFLNLYIDCQKWSSSISMALPIFRTKKVSIIMFYNSNMLDITRLLLSRGNSLTASHWFSFDRATFQFNTNIQEVLFAITFRILKTFAAVSSRVIWSLYF